MEKRGFSVNNVISNENKQEKQKISRLKLQIQKIKMASLMKNCHRIREKN